MEWEAVRKMLNAQPFKPLRFHLSDGSRWDVEHRGNVVMLEDVWVLHLYVSGDKPGTMKDWIAVAPSHIVRVENIKEQPAHKGNGKSKK